MTTSPESDYPVYAGESFGKALAHFRTVSGLTQEELASRIGVTRQYVNELEGDGGTERLDRLVRAFRELGIRIRIGPAPW